MKHLTILEVVDNFFGDELPDFGTLSEKVIEDFAAEVHRFNGSYEPPPVTNKDVFPSFLGGWPSAQWTTFNPLIMTSLLYSGQVLVKDLILDWFSDEQYELPLQIKTDYDFFLLRNPDGYKVGGNSEERLSRNRAFLKRTIPTIMEARPLIDAGILVLAPSKKFEHQNQKRAEEFATSLLPGTIPSVKKFTENFRPSDLPKSDTIRGLFTIGQSANRAFVEQQIRENVREALYYLATEYLFAQHYGFAYTSTFPFEEYVCHNAISPNVLRQSGYRVYQGLLNSKLPLYEGLTPEILASIRDDDSYASFRRELYQVYATIPEGLSGTEIKRHLHEAEEALLRPTLEQLERDEKRGFLSRLGLSRISVLRWAATVALVEHVTHAIDIATGVGVLGEIIQTLVQRPQEQGVAVIWKKLYNRDRTVKLEFPYLAQHGIHSSKPYWGVTLEDGMKVTITEGLYPRHS